jgi:hypothetical protein
MYFNPYAAQMMMEERAKDALREAEQERLFRAARVSNKERKWRLQVALILKGLLATLIVGGKK